MPGKTAIKHQKRIKKLIVAANPVRVRSRIVYNSKFRSDKHFCIQQCKHFDYLVKQNRNAVLSGSGGEVGNTKSMYHSVRRNKICTENQ